MRTKIEKIVFNTLNDMNINKNNILYGKEGAFDSLQLVRFIAQIENDIYNELNISVTIISEKAFSKKQTPFYNSYIFLDYLMELLCIE